jgi:hypothetical protein
MIVSSSTSASRWTQNPTTSVLDKALDGASSCIACAPFANLSQIDNPDRGVFNTLTAMHRGILGVAAPECHNVLVPDQRAPTLKVGYDLGPAAGAEREFHRCRLTIRLSLRLVEVGVAIEEQQPVTAAALKGEQATEQDRAIAPEHDGKLSDVNQVVRLRRRGPWNIRRWPSD